ncbi:MAG: glycosyltransferase family 2 protein, partial [Nitrososphaerales archaeon]
MIKVFAVIATKQRTEVLAGALRSIVRQGLQPTSVLIVGDDESDLAGIDNVEKQWPSGRIARLINKRTLNLSGALNAALLHLISLGVDPEETYLAFLDDDDEWEPAYLAKCLESASKNDSDLVVSGITRHEEHDMSGRRQTIPTKLSSQSFLTTNPHVQGSNTFVRFSSLLKAGGFDENLGSTTDRDVCIRLLDLESLRVSFLNEHLVHHWATGAPRLSSHGSPKKRQSLVQFYLKYSSRMSATEKEQFMERAKDLFGCAQSDFEFKLTEEARQSLTFPNIAEPVDLVVGLTCSNIESTRLLLQDLSKIFSAFEGKKRLIVCDNSTDSPSLLQMLRSLEGHVITKLVGKDRTNQDATDGKFGIYYIAANRRRGIAYGRTVLHHYLYLECLDLSHPVVWVLDDDIRLDSIQWGSSQNPLEPCDFRRLVSSLMSEGCSIAIGKIYGDAPLPVASTIRTQLLDFVFNLEALTRDSDCSTFEQKRAMNAEMIGRFPDYYYDLSLRHYGHLETPLWLLDVCQSSDKNHLLESMLENFPLLCKGVNMFRPIVHASDADEISENGIPMRGGNTLIFDIECLRTFPNIAPISDTLILRRGDTLWSVLNTEIS